VGVKSIRVEAEECKGVNEVDKSTIDDESMAELERLGFFDSGDLEELSDSNPSGLCGIYV
jgi:hypothetical protein